MNEVTNALNHQSDIMYHPRESFQGVEFSTLSSKSLSEVPAIDIRLQQFIIGLSLKGGTDLQS